MASCAWVRVFRAGRALAICAIATAVATGAIDLVDVRAADATAQPGLRLAHLTPVVTRAGQVVDVVLTRAGAAASPGATVQVTLYNRLTTRSGLLAAITTPGPTGPVSSSGALPVSCLPAGSAVALGLAVAPDGVTVPPRTLCGHRAPVLRLGCASGCDGVYPLRITVHGGGTSATIDTVLTYAAVASANPLEFAWVFRVAGPPTAFAGAQGALRAVAAEPTVPVTLDVQGQTLASPAPSAAASLALLRKAAVQPAHELTGEAYVPAELGSLRASGLPDEVQEQFALTASTLRADGVRRPVARTVTVGSGPQTPTSADAVASVGFHHLVIDGTDLASDPTGGLDWGGPFRLGGAPEGPTALASDSELSLFSDSTAQDPALSAANFLGELAFLHYEAPNLPDHRVVVAVTDASPGVANAFVDGVLQGIRNNPVVVPVTLSTAFARVPVGANGFPGVRDLADGPSPAYTAKTVGTIVHLRLTLDALASAVRFGTSPVPSIDGELLSSEQALSPAVRAHVLASVQGRLQDQKAYFKIYDGPITLTQSGGAALPITIFSTAPYTYTGFLVLTSPKLTFPGGHVIQLKGPVGPVYSLRVSANAEVTGDIPLSAVLITPDHRVELAGAVITVQATRTSIVGIALTVLALLVLAVWWIRTSLKRRRAAR